MGASAKGSKRGAAVVRAKLREKFGIEEGSSVPPAVTIPKEVWSPERKAAFLLGNAVDLEGYEWARREARRMGIDPDRIPHGKPET